MNLYLQGLQVSLMGLVITFLALGVFIGIMVILQRLFPAPKEEAPQLSGGEEEILRELSVTTAVDSEEAEVIAAIAAALDALQSAERSRLGESLQEGHGLWWTARRSETHQKTAARSS